ncbi:Yip1 family protein [Halorarius halobius]|uniref:Yip1 family protein n=1 Tax=Halorarius halobius TaxID=2962671 RepID=UPI0020CC6FDA|nr:Yip1 family protein [Halorarius halobius]
MLSALRAALTDPASFFPREAEEPSLRGPVVVVAAVALVGLASSIPVFSAILGTVPSEAQPFVFVGLAVGAVTGLVGPFVVWLVYALLFYGLSALFNASGEFRDLFTLVGWGFAPRVVASLVSAVVLFLLVPESGFSDPTGAQQFARDVATSTLGLVGRGVGLLMTLWSAWVWTHAVAAARDVSKREAAISVGIVVGVGFLLGLASTYAV